VSVALLWSFASTSFATTELTALREVFQEHPEWAALSVRTDYLALSETVSSYEGSVAIKLFAGDVLHGYYHREAVTIVAKHLDLSLRGCHDIETITRWLTRQRTRATKAGQAYSGPKTFPYRWIKDGATIALSLLPHVRSLYESCLIIAKRRQPTMKFIDDTLPLNLGRYSMSRSEKCPYMRRQLARWMAVWLYPRACGGEPDWDLSVHGMGSGPKAAATLIHVLDYRDALRALDYIRPYYDGYYGLHDLVCCLCLALNALRRKIAELRRRASLPGVQKKGKLFAVRVWDGTTQVHVGMAITKNKAAELRANAARRIKRGTFSLARKVIKPAVKKGSSKYVGVSQFRDTWQAYCDKNGVRVHLGQFKSERLAAKAVSDAKKQA
jgi:hypothetical protein